MVRSLVVSVALLTGCASAKYAAPPEAAHGPSTSESRAGSASDAAPEMFDIEARLVVGVEKLGDATTRLRETVQAGEAHLTADEVVSNDGFARGVFDVRVPADRIEKFLAAVAELGHVFSRNVKSTDVSKAYHDSGLLLQNLKLALGRYQELLAKATDVKDMLAIEAELSRVRGEIERVEGERRWMEDRVARATVHIELVPAHQDTLTALPEAKFYPGIRFTDFTSLGNGSTSRLGVGLSFLLGRRFSLDFDALNNLATGSVFKGSDLFEITLAASTYSDLLGGGHRSFLNPYIGLRTGYARVDGGNAGVLGIDLGVEVVRFKWAVLDAQVSGIGLLGTPNGSMLGVQPSLTMRVAF